MSSVAPDAPSLFPGGPLQWPPCPQLHVLPSFYTSPPQTLCLYSLRTLNVLSLIAGKVQIPDLDIIKPSHFLPLFSLNPLLPPHRSAWRCPNAPWVPSAQAFTSAWNASHPVPLLNLPIPQAPSKPTLPAFESPSSLQPGTLP